MKRKHSDISPLELTRATASLDACYKVQFTPEMRISTELDSRDVHAELYAAEHGFRSLYSETYPNKTGASNLQKANIATAGISLLYSTTPLDETPRTLDLAYAPVRVPIDRPQYTFNVASFFGEGSAYSMPRSKGSKDSFNRNLGHRIGLFNQYGFVDAVAGAITNFTSIAETRNFAQTFHHSEQAVMEFFSGPTGRTFITEELLPKDAKTVGAVILDMYSTRYMCPNCSVSMIGFQNSYESPKEKEKEGALYAIGNVLTEERIGIPDDGLLWSTRVSASRAGTGTSHSRFTSAEDSSATHELSLKDRSVVLEANIGTLIPALEEIPHLPGSFQGDYFVSREQLIRKGMEDMLGKKQRLYAEMAETPVVATYDPATYLQEAAAIGRTLTENHMAPASAATDSRDPASSSVVRNWAPESTARGRH